MNNYKPNQKVRVVNFQVAIPADLDMKYALYAIEEMFLAHFAAQDTPIVDFNYNTGNSYVVQVSARPWDTEAFCARRPSVSNEPDASAINLAFAMAEEDRL